MMNKAEYKNRGGIMFIKKGTHLEVNHVRKGKFKGIAIEDFDTETTNFFPIALAAGQYLHGINHENYWDEGDKVPCSSKLCQIKVIEG